MMEAWRGTGDPRVASPIIYKAQRGLALRHRTGGYAGCELRRTPLRRSSRRRGSSLRAAPIGPGPDPRQEKSRAALGRGISEGAQPNDDQIVVPRRPERIPQMSEIPSQSKKYATRRPPPKSPRVAYQRRILGAGTPVLGPWSHGMSQAQYTIRANPSVR